MKINWHEMGTIIATMIAIGGVMIALMRGFFKTVKSCEDTQTKCQTNICKKIDELKDDAKEDRKVGSERYGEIKEALGRIEGNLANQVH